MQDPNAWTLEQLREQFRQDATKLPRWQTGRVAPGGLWFAMFLDQLVELEKRVAELEEQIASHD